MALNSRNESKSNHFVTTWMGANWATPKKWWVCKEKSHICIFYCICVLFVPDMFSFLHVLSSFFSLRYCSSHASKSKEFATKRTATSAVTSKSEVCLKWAGTNQMTTKGTVENAHKFSLISSFGFNVFSLVALYVISTCYFILFRLLTSYQTCHAAFVTRTFSVSLPPFRFAFFHVLSPTFFLVLSSGFLWSSCFFLFQWL